MTRFLSFFAGFLVAFGCGSLFTAGFFPSLPQLAEIRDGNGLLAYFKQVDVGEKVAQVTEFVDATRTTFSDSLDSFDALDLSEVFSDVSSGHETLSSMVKPDAAQLLTDVSRIALQHGTLISDLKHDSALGWVVSLESGESVVLGNEDIHQRLHRSLAMIGFLPQNVARANTVDARYAMGIAVSSTDPVVVMQ